jgi:hypothetical protein
MDKGSSKAPLGFAKLLREELDERDYFRRRKKLFYQN